MSEVKRDDFGKTLATLHLFASGMSGALVKKAEQLRTQSDSIEKNIVKWRGDLAELMAGDLSAEDRARLEVIKTKLDELQAKLDAGKKLVERARELTT